MLLHSTNDLRGLCEAVCPTKGGRSVCTPCRKTFAATQGTVFYCLRTSTALVVTVVTVLAPGCPVHAIVAALEFDERTSAAWWARAGRQGQAVQEALVEPPRDVGQSQADALRGKTQGGLVGMALAMMVTTRLWLGELPGEGKERPRLSGTLNQDTFIRVFLPVRPQ